MLKRTILRIGKRLALRYGLDEERFEYNFKQIWAPSIIFLVLAIYDLIFLLTGDTGRTTYQHYIGDIRSINEYCNYLLVFTAVLLGLLLRLPKNDPKDPKSRVPVAPFGVSLVAASINLLFIPVPYSGSLTSLKVLWAYHILLEQAVVVFTMFGLIGLLLKFMNMHPLGSSQQGGPGPDISAAI